MELSLCYFRQVHQQNRSSTKNIRGRGRMWLEFCVSICAGEHFGRQYFISWKLLTGGWSDDSLATWSGGFCWIEMVFIPSPRRVNHSLFRVCGASAFDPNSNDCSTGLCIMQTHIHTRWTLVNLFIVALCLLRRISTLCAYHLFIKHKRGKKLNFIILSGSSFTKRPPNGPALVDQLIKSTWLSANSSGRRTPFVAVFGVELETKARGLCFRSFLR